MITRRDSILQGSCFCKKSRSTQNLLNTFVVAEVCKKTRRKHVKCSTVTMLFKTPTNQSKFRKKSRESSTCMSKEIYEERDLKKKYKIRIVRQGSVFNYKLDMKQ